MAGSEWVALRDLETFRRYKRSSAGVIVIRGSASTRVHHPDCPHVREDAFLEKLRNRDGGYWWTGSVEVAQARWPGARPCRHPSDPLAGGTGGPEASARRVARTPPRSGGGWSARGPEAGLRAVRAEADAPLPYEPRTPEQRELRAELRERLRRLTCRPDEVLQARFYGPKPSGADVENLLLYNVDDGGGCFAGAARGVRLELSPRPMPRASRPVAYLYQPAPRAGSLSLWNETGPLAEWPPVEVAAPAGWAPVWFALRSAAVSAPHPPPYGDDFAVFVRIRPPAGEGAAAARLVKPLLDGAVAALQAHGDAATLPAVAQRLAAALGRAPAAVEALLAGTEHAALGVVPRLVHLRGEGIQVSPADDRCVAGEVLVDEPGDARSWALRVRVAAVTPR
jgi:hypothetical protein